MATKNVGLKAAILGQDLEAVKAVVSKAIKTYGAGLPEEAKVETVYGSLPISMVFDEDTKWQVITAEYVAIAKAVDNLPKDCDKTVETAKLIATSKVLRHLADSEPSSDGFL